MAFQHSGNLLAQFLAVNDQAHFRIQHHGARIKIELADKNTAAIHDKGLCNR